MRLTSRPLRSTEKAAQPLTVACQMTACVYHEGPCSAGSSESFCSHPNKAQYLAAGACPLYQMDWMKQSQQFRPKSR